MTIFKQEWRQGLRSFAIWTGSIGFFIAICVFLFPEMKHEMDGVSELFASMGSFSAAFGMDRVDFGTLIGFYAVECSTILGIGGAFFAAMTAVTSLSREEQGDTAEFLLTHPVSRARVLTEKLLMLVTELLAMNLLVYLLAVASVVAIGEELLWKELTRIHLAHLLLQLELAGLCFGLSAFLRRGGVGLGLGLATALYFLNIVINILGEKAGRLKYLTPFAFADGAEILTQGGLDPSLVLTGLAAGLLGIVAAFWHYRGKDIS